MSARRLHRNSRTTDPTVFRGFLRGAQSQRSSVLRRTQREGLFRSSSGEAGRKRADGISPAKGAWGAWEGGLGFRIFYVFTRGKCVRAGGWHGSGVCGV
ncbi:hypothetical protein CRG98_034248 [Punica granatum]|uniref:Uncharacterized protein n=1 Tax=Punica granatum TaxID=22663 RepID=A0A2I0INZ9_PUNGR|nr:hypothetical protein CRG98_034248 [Punica granatum]